MPTPKITLRQIVSEGKELYNTLATQGDGRAALTVKYLVISASQLAAYPEKWEQAKKEIAAPESEMTAAAFPPDFWDDLRSMDKFRSGPERMDVSISALKRVVADHVAAAHAQGKAEGLEEAAKVLDKRRDIWRSEADGLSEADQAKFVRNIRAGECVSAAAAIRSRKDEQATEKEKANDGRSIS